jgi:RNA polymerase sigma-70 factor (ECF subfamily)
LLAIANKLPTFEGRSSLSSWAFTLARTACARRRRGLKNQPFASEDDAPEPIDERGSPEDVALERDLRERVNLAIDRLPIQLREVLELRDVQGLPAAEAAASLGITVEALKSRLHRARAALRDALKTALDERRVSTCPDIATAMSMKLEGDLADADCAEIEAHLEECGNCYAECGALREALAMCRATKGGPVPPEVQRQIRVAVRTWAAMHR